jgi:membrane-associated protease RseP (regulator of RpoE activity)
MAGVRVERLFIGADAGDFALLRYRRGHTVYGIGWFPFVSYTRITGAQEAPAPDLPAYDIRSRSLVVQCTIVLAGVAANLITGWLLIKYAALPLEHPVVMMQFFLALANVVPFASTDGHVALRMVRWSLRKNNP